MNVLIVDDQVLIVNSLKNGIQWEQLGVEEVYTATNVRQAKFLLMNYRVDLLITDIEMPEENGIDLAQWVSERSKDTIIVFLTSHPNFEYAKEGLRLHVFDYLLQPIRFSDLTDVVIRVEKELESRKSSKEAEEFRHFQRQNKNAVCDSIVLKFLNQQEEDAESTWKTIIDDYENRCGRCENYPILTVIRQWERVRQKWDDDLIRATFANILAELFIQEQAEAYIANISTGEYWIFLLMQENKITSSDFRDKIARFVKTINEHSSGGIVCCLNDKPAEMIASEVRALKIRMQSTSPKGTDLVWEDTESNGYSEQGAVESAVQYIQEHIYDRISRTELAEYVHLNPEYFSKLFRNETGLSFKDYVLREKMRHAAVLLKDSSLPVSIIASKIGFVNFSHFSHTFKNYYDMTPQDYRSLVQEKNL